MKHKCPSPRIGKKPRGNIGRWLYAAFLTATLSASLCQPASAATVWEKANEIMRDVYTQILGISTIAAIVTAAVALLMMNFSRSGRTVDESRAWLKRIIITWAVLNGLGFIMSYVTPLLQRRAVDRLVNHGHFRWHCRVDRRADHVRSGYDQHLCFGGIGL